MSSNQRREIAWGIAFLSPTMIFMAIFVLYPSLVAIIRSFCDWNFLTLDKWAFTGFSNYSHLFTDKVFRLAMYNLLFIIMGKIFIQVGGGLVIANIINNLKHFKRLLRTIYFLPSIAAPVAVGLLWTFIFEPEMGLVTRVFAMLKINMLAVPWLSDKNLALAGVILVDCWQGYPFQWYFF